MAEETPPPQAMDWRSPYPDRAGLEQAMQAAGAPATTARSLP